MIDGLLARLSRQWGLLGVVAAGCTAVATLLAALAAASGTISGFLASLGLNNPAAAAIAIGAVAAGGFVVGYLMQRAEWSALLADRVRAEDATPVQLGVKRSPRTATAVEDDAADAPYVRRTVDADLRLALRGANRWILVIGDEASGVTRSAFEAVTQALDAHAWILIPSPAGHGPGESLKALLGATLPLRLTVKPTLLWIDDIGPRLERGEISAGMLRAFLRRHPRLKIIATVRTTEFRALVKGGDDATAAAREVIRDAREVVVPRELAGTELERAATLFPDVPPDGLPRLPEYLVAYKEHVSRLELADESPVGNAIVRAAIDWQRSAAPGGAPTAFLQRALRHYLPRSRRSVTQDVFWAGMQWATEPFVGATALLEEDDEGGRWRPSPLLVQHVDRRADKIPVAVWSEVVAAVAPDPAALLAVGTAAFAAGVPDVARAAWEAAAGAGTERESHEAARLLIELADARTARADGPTLPQLLRRVRERSVLDALTSRSPRGVRSDEPTRAEHLFDPRQPRPVGGSAATLYRLRALRFVLRAAVLATLDGLSALGGLTIALALKAAVNGERLVVVLGELGELAPYALGFALPALALAGAYRADSRRARLDRIALALSASAALAAVAGAAHGEGAIYSTAVWASFVFAAPSCLALRAGYDKVSRQWVRRNDLHTRTLVIGDRVAALDAARRLAAGIGRPMRFVGYLSDEVNDASPERLGTPGALAQLLEPLRIHHVVVADSRVTAEGALRILDLCTLRDIGVSLTLSLAEMEVFKRRVPIGQTLPLQRLSPVTLSPFASGVKRVADLVLAATALVALAPLIAAIALATRAQGPGPVFIRSPRLGLGGTTFTMLKLRTADSTLGAQLRRLGLDELAQLLNVVHGTMSLVGPRPLPPVDYDRMEPWHRRRWLVVPGLTGLWQISERPPEIDYDETARLDLLYMRSWSLWRDLEILVRTVPTVLRRTRDGPTP